MAAPLRYNAEKHIPLLHRVFKNGKDIAHFCREAEISRPSFFYWVNEYPEFKEAYEAARETARAHWEDIGEEGIHAEHFNYNIWWRIMFNRFDLPATRRVALPKLTEADSFKARFKLVEQEVEQGKVTPEEALKLANFIGVGAKIELAEGLEERLKALECSPSKDV